MKIAAVIVLGLALFTVPAQAATVSKVMAATLLLHFQREYFQLHQFRNTQHVHRPHSGNAPDPGALESGQPMPHYGPRSWLHAMEDTHTFSVRKNHVQEA